MSKPSIPAELKAVLQFVRKQAREAHKALDIEMSLIPKVCAKGCDACCRQMVYVHTWEEEAIRHYVQNEMFPKVQKEVRKHLMDWWKLFVSVTRRPTSGSPLTISEQQDIQTWMRENRVPCPFLINHECSIYPVRPAICRAHVVSERPELCEADPHRVGIKEPLEPYSRIFGPESTILPREKYPHALKPLAYIATDILKMPLPSTPMEGLMVGGDDV